ncbi:DUF5309 domain-containing protein [Candidatus Micrarchaeota archaeon]|nr:DUF5309 domain-containing protein [Candidatus Micrarchaeota archaeon]
MRESLLSILKDVSPNEDNYLISNLGVGPAALQPLHEWNLFYQARPTSVTGNVEGAATTYTELPVETRSSNRTIIVDEPVRLSRTKASIAMVTGEDALGKEKERALKRLKASIEWNTINGAAASGNATVARGMVGIDGMISTNITARNSGTSFSEVELNDIVQQSWDGVGGEYVMDLLVAPVIVKRRVANMGTNLTRNIDASEKKLVNEIRVYDSEVGQTVAIIAHKDVRAVAGSLTVYGLREDLLEHSFLVKSGEPHWEERAKDGDRENGVYITEFTLVNYQQRAMVKRTGYATTL